MGSMVSVLIIFSGMVLVLIAFGVVALFNNRLANIADLAGSGRVKDIIAIYQDVRNDMPRRQEAVAALVKIATPEILDALCASLALQHQPGLQKILAVELPRVGAAIFPYLQHAFRVSASRPGVLRVLAASGPTSAPVVYPYLLDNAIGLREAAATALDVIGWQPGRDEYAAAYWLAKRQPQNCVQTGPAAVPALIEALKDPLFREGCVAALGELGDLRSGPALLNLGKDPRWNEPVVNALARWKDDGVPLLLSTLRSPDPSLRQTALSVLDRINWHPSLDENGARFYAAKHQWDKCVELGSPALVPLSELLNTDDLELRFSAVTTLGRTGLEGAVDFLAPLLENPDPEQRKQVIAALGNIHSPGSGRALCGLLSDDALYPDTQKALLGVGRPAGEPLVICLRSDSLIVRRRAAETLELGGWKPDGQMENGVYAVARQDWDAVRAWGPVLVDLLIEELAHPQNCLAAALLLADTGDIQAVYPIMNAMAGKTSSLQYGLAEALGKMGAAALDPLLFALDSGQIDRLPLITTLGLIGDPRPAAILTRYLSSGHPGLEREAAARALGRIGEPALDAIFDALRAPGIDPRAASIALGEAGRNACPRLVEALKTKLYDAQVIVYALGKISDENAAAAVLATLQDERYGREVRNTAEKALIEIGTPAVPLLISALVRTPNERTWITPLLARFGPSAVDPLLKALRDSFFPAQSAAIIDALGEIGDARSVGPLMDIIRGHSGNSDAARTALDKVWKKQREGNKDQPPHGV